MRPRASSAPRAMVRPSSVVASRKRSATAGERRGAAPRALDAALLNRASRHIHGRRMRTSATPPSPPPSITETLARSQSASCACARPSPRRSARSTSTRPCARTSCTRATRRCVRVCACASARAPHRPHPPRFSSSPVHPRAPSAAPPHRHRARPPPPPPRSPARAVPGARRQGAPRDGRDGPEAAGARLGVPGQQGRRHRHALASGALDRQPFPQEVVPSAPPISLPPLRWGSPLSHPAAPPLSLPHHILF